MEIWVTCKFGGKIPDEKIEQMIEISDEQLKEEALKELRDQFDGEGIETELVDFKVIRMVGEQYKPKEL